MTAVLWLFAGFVTLSALVILLLAVGPLRAQPQVRWLRVAALAQFVMAGVLVYLALGRQP